VNEEAESRRDASGYRPKETVRPAPGIEPEQWPNIKAPDRFIQLLCQRAYFFALEGGKKKKRLFGEEGRLRRLVNAWVREREAEIDQRGHEREAALQRDIKTAPLRARTSVKAARAQDRRTAAIDQEIVAIDERIDRLVAEEESLSPGQRSGRLVGKEAVAAATATGLGDGAAFVLTIGGVGGPLWLRIAIALTLALVLNVGVMVAGRTVAAMWRMLSDTSLLARSPLVAGVIATLGFLLDRALESAGDFRHHALQNLDKGVATDPHFLVWVGLTGAFAATIALGWWHYASEGDRLIRQRRGLEATRSGLETQRENSTRMAKALRDKAIEVLTQAKRAEAELPVLPKQLADLKAAQRAQGDEFLAAAEEAFGRGKARRRAIEASRRESEAAMDPETEAVIDEAIKDILGR
jgi:hypothetical protein